MFIGNEGREVSLPTLHYVKIIHLFANTGIRETVYKDNLSE